MDHGSNSNGIIPNDAALQNAISSLNGENCTIYFPAGTFAFTKQVLLRSGLVLKGEGILNTVLEFALRGNFSLINIAGNLSPEAIPVTAAVLKNVYWIYPV